ncbi:protein of unknown function UPF0075 [Geitlerinema sp. PCC 7407]|nr:protein of unknown function UPF0075 [Geitlerinema sp. PCC 7407]
MNVSMEKGAGMRVIGLISGTSVDGIDAALVEISGTQADLQATLVAGHTFSYPAALREQILAVCADGPLSMAALAELDDAIALQFAEAAIALQQDHGPAALIGSHGQTVFHRPATADRLGYSLQLGRGAAIAHRTGLPTITNFRAADIAAGGQGAPLVPAVDAILLRHPTRYRCVQNLGGIGNVTYLPPQTCDEAVRGWDTGPANALLDLAVQHFSQGAQRYDQGGAWAAQGQPCEPLVQRWLQQPFFQEEPPKSTGRELFGPAYLAQCLEDAAAYQLTPADTLATLTELTAASVAQEYQRLAVSPEEILLCGGGSRNCYLRDRLQARLPSARVLTTDDAGLSADFKEAIAFAVLAYWRHHHLPGNLPSVTGAQQSVPLGEIHYVGGSGPC